ncbi:MAG: S9 family peptidase [Bryobacterales bacterium]|nr:S9 family peptidase [Bryobacterales bacterium]
MRVSRRPSVALLCVVALVQPTVAQRAAAPPKFDLTIDNIMRGPGLYGYPPRAVRWSGDSQKIYFEWKRHDDPVLKDFATYVVNRDGSNLKQLTEDEAREQAPPLQSDATRDWKLSVYSEDGDLYLYDRLAGRRHRLTHTTDRETQPRFTQDEKRIAYVRNNNLYVLSPDSGALDQLTDIRTGPANPADDEEKKGTDSQEYLKKEEKSLLETVRDQAAKREEDRNKRKRRNPRKPFRLTAKQSLQALYLAPDETYVLARIAEKPEGAKTTVVPNFVTENAYTDPETSRTKVGDVHDRIRFAFLDVKTGESKYLDTGLKQTAKDGKTVDRDVTFRAPRWSDDGKHLAMSVRSADNKDQWIVIVDPTTAKARVISVIHDDAWINNYLMAREDSWGWLKDNRRIWFTSERDGWNHLYTVDAEKGEEKQLTSGKWEVRDVKLDEAGANFLLTTSEVHPGEEHIYRMSLEGGTRERLTTLPGGHDATLSPDGTLLASIFSYTNKPPELYLLDTKDAAAKPVKVTDSPAPEFANYQWLDVPIVQVPARDGTQVPARLYKPKNYRRGGPLVIFVHGAGYLQNVHKLWSNYAREYLFHHLLMERGYLVLDLDYRASAGYGRDWRTAVYRHMGGKDLADQVDAVKWAITQHGVNPKKVGIYGGSYGGFITLMAMFTQSETFQAGAALRPVTDWAHYNHGYTSSILNLPHTDAEAYKASSPIYHAQGLKGALLICHGMVDRNVHFQDTVRLVQRLIELRKENWDVAPYPVEDHAFVQPTSWADEYKRILKLFEENLNVKR